MEEGADNIVKARDETKLLHVFLPKKKIYISFYG